MDLFFKFIDQRIELRDFTRVVPLLVLAEAEQISDVLWPPAMKVELILLRGQTPELFVVMAS